MRLIIIALYCLTGCSTTSTRAPCITLECRVEQLEAESERESYQRICIETHGVGSVLCRGY